MISNEIDIAHSQWQKSIVMKKNIHQALPKDALIAQFKLARAVEDGSLALADAISQRLGIQDNGDRFGIPRMHKILTPKEANNPDPQTERTIAETLSFITPTEALRPAFWAVAYIIWMRDRYLGDDWAKSLVMQNDERTATRVCYQLGGVRHYAGSSSVFIGCPISRAYWRTRFSKRVAEYSEERITSEEVHMAISGFSIWDVLVRGIVKNVAVLNDSRPQAAMCVHFNEIINSDGRPPNKYHARVVMRALAQLSTSYNLAIIPFESMLNICREASAKWHREQDTQL